MANSPHTTKSIIAVDQAAYSLTDDQSHSTTRINRRQMLKLSGAAALVAPAGAAAASGRAEPLLGIWEAFKRAFTHGGLDGQQGLHALTARDIWRKARDSKAVTTEGVAAKFAMESVVGLYHVHRDWSAVADWIAGKHYEPSLYQLHYRTARELVALTGLSMEGLEKPATTRL